MNAHDLLKEEEEEGMHFQNKFDVVKSFIRSHICLSLSKRLEVFFFFFVSIN
jgi:hypothetical protein